MVVLRSILIAAGMLCAGAAGAHVTVEPKTALAGSYQVLRFGGGHGCDGKATTRILVQIPDGVQSARPQPKPGWKLDIRHAPGDAEKVTAIAWSGKLPADQFEEFLIQVHLPPDNGTTSLAFPATQSCGSTQVRWNGGDPAHPAPKIALTPPAPTPDAGHDHHH